jgi:hypothetical protein
MAVARVFLSFAFSPPLCVGEWYIRPATRLRGRGRVVSPIVLIVTLAAVGTEWLWGFFRNCGGPKVLFLIALISSMVRSEDLTRPAGAVAGESRVHVHTVADGDTAYRKYTVALATTTNSALHFHSRIRRMRIPKLLGDSRLHVRCNLHMLELECNAGAQAEEKQREGARAVGGVPSPWWQFALDHATENLNAECGEVDLGGVIRCSYPCCS